MRIARIHALLQVVVSPVEIFTLEIDQPFENRVVSIEVEYLKKKNAVKNKQINKHQKHAIYIHLPEEVSFLIFAPNESGIQLFQFVGQSQTAERRLVLHHPIAVVHPVDLAGEEDDIAVGALVDGVDPLQIDGQLTEQAAHVHRIAGLYVTDTTQPPHVLHRTVTPPKLKRSKSRAVT